MIFTEKEVQFFKRFNTSRDGKILLGYLERLKIELGDLSLLTKDNFDSRKDAIQIINDTIIVPLKAFKPDVDSKETNRKYE